MEIIRPSADLRNKYKEISEPCKSVQEPVYITANEKEDTAIIASSASNLMQKINEGIADANADRIMSLEEEKNKLLWLIK